MKRYNLERVLHAMEHGMFAGVAILLFVAGFVLAIRSCVEIFALVTGPQASILATTGSFIDQILLILMIAEIAYTVTLYVRGRMLSLTPFLIVGLIAIIRHFIVITVQEAQPHAAQSSQFAPQNSIELAILTGVILAFAIAIRLLAHTKASVQIDED